jgi:DNA-binding IclR family transcriptional regulator
VHRLGSKGPPMKTIRKAFLVLRQFTVDAPEFGLTEMSRATGISKPIVHKILRTLIDEEMVVQNADTRRYRLGPGILAYAGQHQSQLGPAVIARPHLLELWKCTNETIHLCLRSGRLAMIAQVLESGQTLRVSSRLGERAPLHCTAAGKTFLAFGGPELIHQAIEDGLTPLTPQTITDPVRLDEEMRSIRSRGYAIDREEIKPEFCAVSAPIFDYTKSCVATVVVATPPSRFDDRRIDEILPHLFQASEKISHELGMVPPDTLQA